MLDGIDAGANGSLGPLRSVGVGSRFLAERMRFVHDGVGFFLGELRDIHFIGGREHAASGANLDHIGAIFDVEADRTPSFLGTVDDAVLRPGLVPEQARAETILAVAMAAGGADGMHRHQHARSWNDARRGGVAQTDIHELQAAHVASSCHSRQQSFL